MKNGSVILTYQIDGLLYQIWGCSTNKDLQQVYIQNNDQTMNLSVHYNKFLLNLILLCLAFTKFCN